MEKLSENILGNLITRGFLSIISKRNKELSSLEKVIRSYNGKRLSLRDIPTKITIEIARKIVGLKREDMKKLSEDIFLRNWVLLYTQSIAKFGITKPQKYTAPHIIVWNITNHCNLGTCKYCYQNSSTNKTSKELNLEKKLDLVNQFADMNVGYIIFSGGEPLTSKDFFKVAKYTVKKRIGASIATNGILLNKENAKKLKGIGIRTVNVTLNGVRAEIHDSLVGKKGIWEKSVNAIKNSKKYGLRVETDSVITPENFSELEELINFSINLGVDGIKLLPLIPSGRGKEVGGLSNEQMERIIQIGYENFLKGKGVMVGDAKYLFELNKHDKGIYDFLGIRIAHRGCCAGRSYCAIQSDGIITPCPFLPIEAGDIKKETFYNIWNNSELFKKLRDRNNLKGTCGECKDKDYCGGCRARAYGETGDYLGSPACNRHSQDL